MRRKPVTDLSGQHYFQYISPQHPEQDRLIKITIRSLIVWLMTAVDVVIQKIKTAGFSVFIK